jgi:oligopeptidase A
MPLMVLCIAFGILQLSGLPEDATAAADLAQQKSSGLGIFLHFPSYYPVMQHAENRALRRLMYVAYVLDLLN